jgi:23S rRNA (guanine745-N1)-methyltransferase
LKTILACTVRNCGIPLERRERAYVCSRGHSYDIARGGYVNLLQPQDRRSLTAGDSPAAVEARQRLLDAGAGRAVITELIRHRAGLTLSSDAVAVDLGSGSGDALAAVASDGSMTGIGIDLSTAAARHAARRFPTLTWVVANADRRLPLVDRRVSLVMSLHGRRNPLECARVLPPGGWLFVAVPAPDDLIELRTLIQGRRIERSRVDALLADHEPLFRPVERFEARERRTMSHESLLDLLRMTYRGARASASHKVASLPPMDVTLASDCVLLERRRD